MLNYNLMYPYLARVLVNQMEDCVMLRIPVHGITDAFAPQFTSDDLEQVHLNGLLNEDHIVLSHRYVQRKTITH